MKNTARVLLTFAALVASFIYGAVVLNAPTIVNNCVGLLMAFFAFVIHQYDRD
jgi:hypothetical protein